MPFYEYQCKSCGAQVEVLQKITDAPLKKCSECGKSQLVKLVSAPVFRLKGGGWYETDFKGDQDKKRNLVDNESREAKSEDKPAAEKPADKADKKDDAKPAKADDKPAAKPVKPAKAKARLAAKKAAPPKRRAKR